MKILQRGPWLFSAPVDLAAFLGSALLSLLLLAIGAWLGVLHEDAPEWTWVPAILMIDVAHVYSTGFRVYFVPGEFQKRPWLYSLTPGIALLLGMAIYSEGELFFWRTLAYLAVFHFVRQQYGWVALYRARAGETDRLGWWIDATAVYLATVYPLIYWHAHLPRQFWWFLNHDFAPIPIVVADIVAPFYWAALAVYALRAVVRWWRFDQTNPGKDIVVATTAICWYVGIVHYNSDYAFTVTNVIIHGVPYLVLVYWYRFEREADPLEPSARWPRIAAFLATIWMLAYVEEFVWHRGIWHDRGWLFGSAWEVGAARLWLVPLLAVPQITHYILDGFIWKRKQNPQFAAMGTVES